MYGDNKKEKVSDIKTEMQDPLLCQLQTDK